MESRLTLEDIKIRLAANKGALEGLKVASLRVFGSFGRDSARAESDVDILVVFDGKATFDRFMDTRFFLEDLLGRSVDLVTEAALRPELKATIEREAIRVA